MSTIARESVLETNIARSMEGPRIAVASSGLGHVARGVETWALDLGTALNRAGHNVTVFQGSGESTDSWRHALNCKRRWDPDTERWARRFARIGGWRLGLASGYDLEQTTFAMKLWPRIRSDYDILHVQDPWLALVMERLHRMKLSRPRVVLAHGTEEPAGFLRKFSNLQHLAPSYLNDWASVQPRRQKVFAIGNFVDIETFSPGDRAGARREFGLPADDLIVLCVAAIKKTHKRVDYLLREFAVFAERYARGTTLVVAGAREPETEGVIALGREILGDRVRFLEGIGRERMPSLYRTADLFALASIHEMMPIALLEALASGLPIACNRTPTLQWMVGPEIPLADISHPGALADQLTFMANPERMSALSLAARRHAETTFSEPVVVKQVLEMYSHVLDGNR